MNFAYSEEQESFRATLRQFLAEKAPSSETLRALERPAGHDPALWKQMAGELGLLGLHLPEDCGGQGYGALELGIACEEMGRALVCAPWFSSACLAASAILHAGTPAQRRRWLPALASGEAVGTLALLDAGDEWTPEGVALELAREGPAYRLEGRKRFVTDGAAAELLVVAARLPETRGAAGVTLAVLRAGAAGVAVRPLEPFDPTRGLADLELDGARAEPLGPPGGAAPALARTLDEARVCLALEAAGGAAHCLESAVAYAKQRVQFGRPIGSFQAIKHSCAELLLEVESARSAAYWASWVASAGGPQLALAASVAKSFCDEAFLRAAEDNVHIHGGIGVTWEGGAQLHYKRARANATLLGSPTWQRARIADALDF
jgi:alkylation response protein AidB-like acyl-CoA dehydrogenase